MGQKELLDSLQLKAEEQAREIWRSAEAEAEGIRKEAQRQLEIKRRLSRPDQAAVAEEMLRSAALEAQRKARRIRGAAKNALSERLYQAALPALPSFRNRDYEQLFAALADELPPLAWQQVRVNPEDLGLAGKIFPEADLIGDPAISGGMVAIGENASLRIDNSLEKRLERGWSDILPDLLRKICDEAGKS